MTTNDSTRQGRCAAHLRALLEGPYKHVWLRAVSREREGRINYSAIAKVLTRTAELDRPDGVHHRELRDRVRRALLDGRLSATSLELFIRAFNIHRSDADRLWTLLLDRWSEQHAPVPEPRAPLRSEDGANTADRQR
jgi:hypothetical protein